MRRGFTLIEMLVAISVFLAVSLAAISSLLTISAAQKKLYFIQTNQDNVRFALEAMAREIRTGIDYEQDGYCMSPEFGNVTPNPDKTACFQFVNGSEDTVVFLRSEDTNYCPPAAGAADAACILKATRASGVSSPFKFLPLTAPETNIYRLRFIVAGEDISDEYQSRVTIILGAETPGANPNRSKLDVQTTVSQLKLDTPSF